jgi:hypothetical protein
VHATVDPRMSEWDLSMNSRAWAWEGELSEVKHLSRTRRRNQHEIPLVAASESGRAQTESAAAMQ